jgi:hypothetical protein
MGRESGAAQAPLDCVGTKHKTSWAVKCTLHHPNRGRRTLALFQKADPSLRAQRDCENKLKGKRSLRDEKAEQLRTAEGKLAECRATVEALALESDEAKLDSALQARREAEDKACALGDASVKIAKEIADLEAEIERIIDQRMRSETSAAVGTMVARLEKAAAIYDAAALEFEASARELSSVVLDAHPLTAFLMSARTQPPPTVAVIVRCAKDHAAAVLAGSKPASLPREPEPAPVLKLVKPDTLQLFFRRHAKYVDKDGKLRLLPKAADHEVPRVIGERALKCGCATQLSDPVRKQLHGTTPPLEPNPAWCDDLGGETDNPPVAASAPSGPPIKHSGFGQFERLDRGPAYKAGFSRPAEPEPEPMAVGQRAMPEDEQP